MGLWRKCQRVLGIGGRRRDIPSDVYLVSFPKCGRTWLTLLIGRALQQHFGLTRANPLKLRKLCDRREDLPKIAPTHDDLPQWKRPDELSEDKSRYLGRKVIFLVRDPRDVLISNYFQKKKRVKPSKRFFFFTKPGREWRVPFEGELGDFLHHDVGSFDSILRFFRIWEEQRYVPDGFLLIRYEDLHGDAAAELRRVLDFVGLPGVSDDVVREAVEFASFDNMHRMEQRQQFRQGKLKPADAGDADSYKTRRGKVGGYVDYLSEDQVADLNRRMRETLPPFYRYEPCADVPAQQV
jgi:hypothetical protein